MLTLDQKSLIKKLRSQGLTYTEICEELGHDVPRGTLSYICKGVMLPEGYAEKMRLRNLKHMSQIQGLALTRNKEIQVNRLKVIEDNARKIVTSIRPKDVKKIHLAMLYIGEGSKYGSYRGLSLGSSDVTILQLYMRLLIDAYGKEINEFRARVQYRADQDLQILQKYWSSELGIPLENFYRSTPDKRTIGKPTKNISYKGVCVVSCNGADIQLELSAVARLYAQKIWGISSFG